MPYPPAADMMHFKSPSPRNPSIAEKLCKAEDLLAHLCKRKSALEGRVEKNLKDTRDVKVKIDEIEDEVECVAEEKMSSDMKTMLWHEIDVLKKERQRAIKHLQCNRSKLKRKFKEYKALSTQLL